MLILNSPTKSSFPSKAQFLRYLSGVLSSFGTE
jgi:hypothetical protein